MTPAELKDTATSVELRKPNALIAMRPVSGKLTTVGRKIFNALLAQTQAALLDVDSHAKLGAGWFETPLRSLLIDAGLNATSGGAVEDVKRYLAEMRHVNVDWLPIAVSDKLPLNAEKVLADESGLLYRTRLVDRDGMLWAQWLAPPEILEALACREILWTRLHLGWISELKSYAAVALYEICLRYKTHVSGLTSRQSVAWWTDALSRAPSGAERREWRKFKSEQLKPAIQEINERTDIEIELKEHKQGRAISEAQFIVKRVQRQAPQILQKVQEVDPELVQRARKTGISPEQFGSLCKGYGEERVKGKLSELELRLSAKNLATITSPLGYLKTILRSGDAPAKMISDTDESLKEIKSASDALAEFQAQRAAEEQKFVSANEKLVAEISQLDEQSRADLISRAMARFTNSPVCTPAIRQRIEAKRFEHPVLAAFIKNFYSEEVYG